MATTSLIGIKRWESKHIDGGGRLIVNLFNGTDVECTIRGVDSKTCFAGYTPNCFIFLRHIYCSHFPYSPFRYRLRFSLIEELLREPFAFRKNQEKYLISVQFVVF